MSNKKTILVCRCEERGLVADTEVSVDHVIPDLCCAAQEKNPILAEIASAEHPVVYACHPRAVKYLFEFAGHPLPEETEFINLRNPERPNSNTPTLPHSRPAWFPVIDTSRCTNCGQCYEFCLFGVYEKENDGQVVVTHPQACKNNCPACARICPETAIMFPKVGESPIDGAEVSDEAERQANVKINIDEILGDDVYAALNARKKKRRSLLNKKKIEKALAERKQCSKKDL